MTQPSLVTLSEIYIGIYILLIFLIIFIIYTFIKSVDYYRLSTKKEIWNKLIDDEILLHLFEDKENPNPVITKEMKSDVFKQFFIERIINSLDSFSGSYRDKIKNILEIYQLNQFSQKKLKQKNPYILAQGIRELIVIQDKDALTKVKPFINHPNRQVQEECQFGLVYFLAFDGLYFLDHLKTQLSEWQQIRLLSILPSLPNCSDEEFEQLIKWLNSSNESIIIFTLKIIQKSQILRAEDYILKLLTSHNPKIVSQAIKTFTVINSPKTANHLIEFYPNQELSIQLEIFNSLQNLDLSHQKEFLISETLKQTNISIKKQAVYIYLKNITSTEEIKMLFDHNIANELEIKTIILEVANKLIFELNSEIHKDQITILNEVILDYK